MHDNSSTKGVFCKVNAPLHARISNLAFFYHVEPTLLEKLANQIGWISTLGDLSMCLPPPSMSLDYCPIYISTKLNLIKCRITWWYRKAQHIFSSIMDIVQFSNIVRPNFLYNPPPTLDCNMIISYIVA